MALRKAANAIMRDLKNRFFKRIMEKFNAVKVADAIDKGSMPSVETMFESPCDDNDFGIVYVAYGESNRADEEGKEFVMPATNQHLDMWSEMTKVKDMITGRTMDVPAVGGSFLERYIKELTALGGGVDLTVDGLSLFIAYAMAKEYGININHGFNLKLAAQEWKSW